MMNNKQVITQLASSARQCLRTWVIANGSRIVELLQLLQSLQMRVEDNHLDIFKSLLQRCETTPHKHLPKREHSPSTRSLISGAGVQSGRACVQPLTIYFSHAKIQGRQAKNGPTKYTTSVCERKGRTAQAYVCTPSLL